MRRWGAALVGCLVLGCSTVELAQKDGCWVRHTKSFPSQVKEEIGVCSRTPPQWSSDRVTRLVQECMVEADYRWKNLALDAWNRGQPLPPERPEHEVMQQCMNDAATSLVRENQTLEKRIAELTHERDGLVAQTSQDHQDLRDNQTRMTEALGEAAKRPTPNAFALATSSGSADTKAANPQPAPVVVPTTVVPVQLPTIPGVSVAVPTQNPATATAHPGAPAKKVGRPPTSVSAPQRQPSTPKQPAACAPAAPSTAATTAERATPVTPPVTPATAPAATPAVK